MKDIEKKLSEMNGTLDALYEKEVDRRIRMRYSLSAELSIGRQKESKPEEWQAYYDYCEECKKEAKAAVYG